MASYTTASFSNRGMLSVSFLNRSFFLDFDVSSDTLSGVFFSFSGVSVTLSGVFVTLSGVFVTLSGDSVTLAGVSVTFTKS